MAKRNSTGRHSRGSGEAEILRASVANLAAKANAEAESSLRDDGAQGWKEQIVRRVSESIATAINLYRDETRRFTLDCGSRAEVSNALANLVSAVRRAGVIDSNAPSNIIQGPWGLRADAEPARDERPRA